MTHAPLANERRELAGDSSSHWHALTGEECARRLEVAPARGLDAAEAVRRRQIHGPNQLEEKKPRSKWALFFDQFKSLLILILVCAAVLAGAIGDVKDAAVIMVVTMINAVLGFYQESRAEQSLRALKKMLALMARVRRVGEVAEIPVEELVPGDIVLLEAGARVPADGRLLVSETLEIDESSLTGESHPVAKSAEAVLEQGALMADRHNAAYMNTMVTRGRGEMVVTATGNATEIGRLAMALQEATEPPTPLQMQLDRLGKRLTVVAAVFIAIIFALGLAGGHGLIDTVLEAIALAVAAVPEGLPAVVTVTLALGMQRMARKRAIVKRLAAVETLGCTSVICSDKTGTLTLNQMTARGFYFLGRRFRVTGEGYRPHGEVRAEDGGPAPDLSPILYPIVLCNDSRVAEGRVIGDPMEGALIILGEKGGLQRTEAERALPRVAEIPFAAEHQLMATFHQENGSISLFVKGAPEALIQRAAYLLEPTGARPMDAALRERLVRENGVLAGQRMRVLAVASRKLATAELDASGDLWRHMEGLTLVGLVGLVDPPRPEARDAIAQCHAAGIDVKMITGDHPETAASIAAQLGLGSTVMTGRELDQLDSAQLAERIGDVAVLARVTPAHKVKIVEALQRLGRIVAMTGDGVNDAPALKNAHIGVAMGNSGTEVAKEAATMVLTDDNFATIVGAVAEGRTIYDNIVKFVRFQLSTNIGALLSMLMANMLGLPAPFHPVQILWVNIIMDGPPAMAMGLEPERRQIMRDPPRSPSAEILSWTRLTTLLIFGSIMVAGTLGIQQFTLGFGRMEAAATMAFTTFVLFQMFNAFNARVEKGSAFTMRFFANPTLWLSLAGVILLQVVAVHWSAVQPFFHTTSLTAGEWALSVTVAASVLLYGELHRALAKVFRDLRARPA